MTVEGLPRKKDVRAAVAGRLYAGIDRFIPDEGTRSDPDALRRARLLVICSVVFPIPALLFAQQTGTTPEIPSVVPLAFLVVAGLSVVPAFVLRRRGSVAVAGGFLTLACLAFDLFMAGVSGGFTVSALLWATTTPVMAAFFVGRRFSLTVATLAGAAMAALFVLDRQGFPFPVLPSPPEQTAWFELMSLFEVTFLLALFSWLYEQQTSRGLRQLYAELQQTNAVLQERESRYRSLTEEASDAIFVSTRAGQLVEVNARACELTGYTRPELLQMPPATLMAAGTTPLHDHQRESLLQGEAVRYELDLVRKDGSTFPAEISLRRTSSGLIQSIARDMTERRRYEADLVEAKEQAEEMNRLKSAFLANMSHEIRTPLTSILGFAEVLSEAAGGEERDFATLILRNGQRLMDTLNSVLDLAQIESRTLKLHLQPFDVAGRVRESVVLLQPLAQGRGLYLRAETPNEPATATLDPTAFERVFTNLVTNALKFTRQGGVTVRVGACERDVVLQVHDTGIGISPAFLPHLFDEFEQESTGLRRTHEGVGLGLTITNRLVELMHGRIEVTSEQGQGSTFTVTFPRRLDA